LAFLPMVALLILTSALVTTRLTGRVSPRVTIPAGMLIAGAGVFMLTGLRLASSFALVILPATMLVGIAAGAIFSTGSSIATLGVKPDDAGVASATVNTMQQIGASVGTALLNTLATSAAASYTAAHLGDPRVTQLAAVHSYQVAFLWSAGIFAFGAAIVALLLRSGVPFLLQRSRSDQ
jgi:MFS family permease